MLTHVHLRSLSPEADGVTYKSASVALASALRDDGACLLQLPASSAKKLGHAADEACAGFQTTFREAAGAACDM